MAEILPPPPVGEPFGAYQWDDWYRKVRTSINSGAEVSWVSITGKPSLVETTRTITTTAPLTGGGDLTTNRTLAVNTFTSAASGIVPASGGGTTNFLRADGTWNTPSGGGSGLSTTATITVPNNSWEHTQVVTFTGCTALTEVVVQIAKHDDADENDAQGLDVISLTALPGVNQATIEIAFREQASGPIKLNLVGI